ncbi:MAG TPA: SUMF1/EgtB/PvdO family nonheme iron enzyme [Steroidobacteraceae bacterium]|nr:SUMF1/EgtB/PvdO family nonheme iron enzyme [Steroidobacteraceae bacterium]
MRIFLSYASEDRAPADAIRLALESDGHDVFFDREDLPPGGEFHTRIRRGIEEADLVIFLLSPKTIDAGSYTLTEISIAEKAWPKPDGRILPVILERVNIRELPPYLTSVTILETPGNLAAEVAASVDRIARARSRRRLLKLVPVAVVAALAVAAGAWYFADRGPATARNGKDGAPAVLVPAGKFVMGDDESAPRREIFVEAFYMDRFEVTTARYSKFLEGTAAEFVPDLWDTLPADSGQLPVIGVSWTEANAYCRWAGRRLPTEAEWEKAARGTDARIYPWGDASPTIELANYQNAAPDAYGGGLSPVGTHAAGRSPYGVEDLAGNAAEWVADWHSESFKTDDVYNPRGPSEGEKKVIRGGGRYDPPQRLVTAARQYASPETRGEDIGFRCASDP